MIYKIRRADFYTWENWHTEMGYEEALEYLQIRSAELATLLFENQIPAYVVGDRWFFKKPELDQWIKDRFEGDEQDYQRYMNELCYPRNKYASRINIGLRFGN